MPTRPITSTLLVPTLALALAAGLLAATRPAAAGRLEQRWVPASADWVMHVDMDAMRGSSIGRMLLEHPETLHLDLSHIDAMSAELGLDLRTDVMSVTAYGSSGDEDDGAVIAVTSEKIDAALERLRDHPDVEHETLEVKGYVIHAFDDGDEQYFIHRRRTNRPDRRVVVIDDATDGLVDALAVIDGAAPNLSARTTHQPPPDSPRAWTPPARGSIVYLAVFDASGLPEIEHVAEVVRMSEAFTIDMGEADGRFRATAGVYADSAQDARNIADVVQGVLALGRLAASEEPSLAPLRDVADAITIHADGRRLTLALEFESRKLIDGMTANR